ncbi:long-chain fatty acid--CoA ligase [Arthrobacter sp. M4]|uniref:acyl-CoA synthetase n=1 Tax=Arthrobacter sp. M4 TaxID=218160 RepID=UPI001CDBF425|nr:long-chain fatty acid--CoA ligase [Arthrobacter sp. M4]MCA4135288.1 long-chain fatty acid--CoA ligase [Arthrobacter sp. M4]
MATFQPDAEALICGEIRLSYRALDERSDLLAAALQDAGLRKGDCVATLAWNTSDLVVTEVALYKAGLVRAPINARLEVLEIRHLLSESGAKVLLTDSEHLEMASAASKGTGVGLTICYDGPSDTVPGFEELLSSTTPIPVDVECCEDDLAVLHFTSGSTGKLKAAMQSYGNRMVLMRKNTMHPDTRIEPGGKQILAGPITHASGMPLMSIFFTGGCAIVMRNWDPVDFLTLVERERATHAFLVPTMINTVLARPDAADYDLSSLRRVIYGAAPMSAQRIQEAWNLFGPVLAQGFGAGETTSGVMFLSTEDHRRAIEGEDPELLLSCGRPFTETEVQVIDDEGKPVAPGEIGEVAVRGPDVVAGYYRDPELTAASFADGWFLTGDLARCREDGYVFIVDRKKDMIISGGFNIYSVEVESVLHQHPGVLEAAVVGVPDEEWGEAVKAVVVPRDGVVLDEQELIAFCSKRLSRMKKPRSVDFAPVLPINQNGKTDRKTIRERYWASAARHVN